MIKINLLSPEKKDVSGVGAEAPAFAEEKKEAGLNIGAAVGAAILSLGLIGFLYITQANTIEAKMQEREDMKSRKEKLKDVEDTLKELEKTKKELTQKVELINGLKSQKQTTVKMMDNISDALPEWVWLSRLTFLNNKVNLSGRAIHNNLIADFINNMKATGSFTKIEFQQSSRGKQSGLDVFSFNITCVFKEKTSGSNRSK